MLLFVCHASEDQGDFVGPLVHELEQKYQVWYSEYQLVLGDSLLRKIDEGLASCDFGIVVLSEAFFSKEWPRAELDGLFARETLSGKLILPIWKDVDKERVAAFSPILAGRLAVKSTEGLARVVEKIDLAVNVSSRQRKVTATDVAANRVREFRQSVSEARRVEQLAYSERGTELVTASLESLFAAIRTALSTDEDASSPVKFGFTQPTPNGMLVRTIRGMYLSLQAKELHLNSVANTILAMRIFKRDWDLHGLPASDLIDFHSDELKPSFDPGDQVKWSSSTRSATYDTDALAAHLVDLFLRQVEAQAIQPRG